MSTRKDLNFWIYDFEVFKYDWLVSFKNFWSGKIVTFHNNRDGLLNFLKENPEMILIGYNNAHYDDWILFGVIHDVDPYRLSTYIIEDGGSPYLFPPFRGKKKTIISYDMIRDMSLDGIISLKQVEGYLGKSIYESKIPFDIDRPLTEEELKETLNYNLYDIETTYELVKRFGDRMDAHIALIETYDMKPWDLSLTGARKGAEIFKAKAIEKYDTFKYNPTPFIEKELGNTSLLQYFKDAVFSTNKANAMRWIEVIQDQECIFGVGGLHMAIDNYRYEGEIWNLDVASYYPNMILKYSYMSRACPGGVKALEEIIQQRLKYKAEGHILNNALKLVIVAIYGNMKFTYSKMWDQLMQTSICITGQLMLFILAQKLAEYSTIIQINTDGIMLIPHDKTKCEEIWHWWEQETQMVLELDTGIKVVQKDVNNYIYQKCPLNLIDWTSTQDKKKRIKSKGIMTRFWNEQAHKDSFDGLLERVNNNMTILDEALVNYLIKDKPVMDTLLECKDLIRFQRIIKLQGKYKDCYLGNTHLPGRVFRVFAVKDGEQVYKCYAKVLEDGSTELKKEKFANTSSSGRVVNDDITTWTTDDVDLDYNYYLELVNQNIKLFIEQRTKKDKSINKGAISRDWASKQKESINS